MESSLPAVEALPLVERLSTGRPHEEGIGALRE
jgi:hypothetical protein